MKKKFFKYNKDAKLFQKKNGGKIRPVFEIGPNGGKNFKGYNVELGDDPIDLFSMRLSNLLNKNIKLK